METYFLDRRKHRIQLVEFEEGLQAQHEGKIVGQMLVVEVERAPNAGYSEKSYRLFAVVVEEHYQALGIGIEMLRQAQDWFYPLSVPQTLEEIGQEMTPAYRAFIASALRRGLLLKEWPKEKDVRKPRQAAVFW